MNRAEVVKRGAQAVKPQPVAFQLESRSTPFWYWLGLALILVFDVWLRCHTIAPTIKDRLGLEIWPVIGARSEPLDCDEAIYAYMGRRMTRGDVLYRNLTENKPPLGYWIYALAIRLGGATELTIRIMPIPFVLATIVLVWECARRIGGPLAATAAALLFAIVSTDPYVFGNGSNLEHFMNMFSILSFALLLMYSTVRRRAFVLFAGAAAAAAALVKPVEATHLAVLVGFLMLDSGSQSIKRSLGARVLDVVALACGFVATWALAIGVLSFQGALRDGLVDFVSYARALTTEIPVDSAQPSAWIRWLTGNASPEGRLPWPFGWLFGRTTYLVWWGKGLYPLWIVSVPVAVSLAFSRSGFKRMLTAWYVSSWIQVAAPGLYWQHYYMLPLPVLSIMMGVVLIDAKRFFWSSLRTHPLVSFFLALPALIVLLVSIASTILIQYNEYLQMTPEAIVRQDKGGNQWLALRELGGRLAIASRIWNQPKLFVWGWQSPLYIYSKLDGVTRHAFADPLLKAIARDDAQAKKTAPWVRAMIAQRLAEITHDVESKKPELIFVGDPPYPALTLILNNRYVPQGTTPEGLGLWVEKTHARAFAKTFQETADKPARENPFK